DDFVIVLFLVALAVSAASITLTRARISQPLRDWLEPRNFLLYKLASCPYCMSHWLAAPLATYTIFGVTSNVVVDWMIAWFTLVGLSALLEGLMMNLLHMQENRIIELEAALEARDEGPDTYAYSEPFN